MTDSELSTFLDHYFHTALHGDVDAFAGIFAEDCVLEDPVGTPPLRGRAAIREFLRAGRALIADSRLTVNTIKRCCDECAVHWSAEVRTVRGDTLAYDGIGVFMFAGPGQLRHVKEYYDVAQLARLFTGEA